jgi:hypothetical protein
MTNVMYVDNRTCIPRKSILTAQNKADTVQYLRNLVV